MVRVSVSLYSYFAVISFLMQVHFKNFIAEIHENLYTVHFVQENFFLVRSQHKMELTFSFFFPVSHISKRYLHKLTKKANKYAYKY